MIERRGRSRLRFEPVQLLGIRGHGGQHDLDCNCAAEARIPRPVHLPHPARAQEGEHLVGTDTRPDGQGHDTKARARSQAPSKIRLNHGPKMQADRRAPKGVSPLRAIHLQDDLSDFRSI
jgi:hypothetical protein